MRKFFLFFLFCAAGGLSAKDASPPLPPTFYAAPIDTPHFLDDRPVVFSWNANTEPDLAGYKVYWDDDASSVPYAHSVVVGNVLTKSVTLTAGLYWAALTAFDATGNESGYSAELVFYVDVAGGGGGTVTDSITVQWKRPVYYDNGQALPPNKIDHYDIVAWLTSDLDMSGAVTLNPDPIPPSANPVTAELSITLPDGTYYLAVYCYTDEGTIVQGLLSDTKILIVPITVTTKRAVKSTRIIIIPRPQ